jgi:hypothetical protein
MAKETKKTVELSDEEEPLVPPAADMNVTGLETLPGAVLRAALVYIPLTITRVTISLLLIVLLVLAGFISYQIIVTRAWHPSFLTATGAISDETLRLALDKEIKKTFMREVSFDLRSCSFSAPTYSCYVKGVVPAELTSAFSKQSLRYEDYIAVPVAVTNCPAFGGGVGCQNQIFVTNDGAGYFWISRTGGFPAQGTLTTPLRVQVLFVPYG